MRIAPLALIAATAAVFFPGGARAGDQTLVFRSGPITIAGFGVNQGQEIVPSPKVDGYVTGMSADVVDAAGNSVPVSKVMLHHAVFVKVGARDSTCKSFTDYDGRTSPVAIQRFYEEGEERAVLALPAGYGYPNRGSDSWALVFMLMNHKAATRTVYVRYTVHYSSGNQLTPVQPYWFDEHNCSADPKFDVPGTGPLFSTYSKSTDYVMPESGRMVAILGHLHGGGVRLELSDRSCGTKLFTSEPTWGLPVVHPIIHEPGPKHMTTLTAAKGIPVAAGDRLRLTAVYDNSLPHARAMGVMVAYLAPGPVSRCEAIPPLPADPLSHPSAPPRFHLPLVRQPVGPVRKVLSSFVGDFAYSAQRVAVKRGTTFRWRFSGPSRHDVTLASGPVGFSSQSRASGTFSFRFTKPGVYRLFCSLHPTVMTQVVTVR